MEKPKLLKISSLILFVLSLILLALGILKGMVPPILTGLGFLVQAIVLQKLSKG